MTSAEDREARAAAREGAQRAARRRRVFGDALPDVTGDELADGSEGRGDEWYQRQRPPHHE